MSHADRPRSFRLVADALAPGIDHDRAMATRTFDIEASVGVGPVEAIDFLLRLDRHPGLHPYFTHAEVVADGSDDVGPWTEWKVTETSRLGPFSYPLQFPTRTARPSGTEMTSLVRPAPGCRLHISAHAVEITGGAHVTETITVSSPRPVVGYMTRQARFARGRLLERLADVLGTPHL